MSYVVKYHPEGWHSAKDEPPEERGWYYCADANGKTCDIAFWNGTVWIDDNTLNNPPVTHWTYLPTPPWEIFPKENTDA